MSQETPARQSGLDRAILGGLAWTAGAKWMTQAVTWASVLISARLLSPADFGTAEMSGFFTGITNILAEFGIGTAVLQMHELERRAVSQLNTVSAVVGALMLLFGAAAAPLVALFFHSDKVAPLVVVNSTTLLITGFQAIPTGLLQKEMNYRLLSISEAVFVLVQAVVTVLFAWLGYGYWALVAGPVAGKFVSAALVIYWRPHAFALPRWKSVEPALRLAWHVTVGRLAWVLYSQSDSIIVGRVMGDSALGAYRLATHMASAPAEKVAFLIMRVVGPLFAKVQTDLPAVRRYFRVVTETLALSIFPLTFGLAAVAPEFVRVVLGPQWEGVVGPVRWLAVFMGVRTMNSLITQVLTSLRHTRFTMWMSLLNFVAMPLAFWAASGRGAAAVAAAWVILAPVTIGPSLEKLLRAADMRRRDYFDSLFPAAVASAAMLAAVLALRVWFPMPHSGDVARLGVQVGAGGLVYLLLMSTVFRERLLRYVNFLRSVRKDKTAPATIET